MIIGDIKSNATEKYLEEGLDAAVEFSVSAVVMACMNDWAEHGSWNTMNALWDDILSQLKGEEK